MYNIRREILAALAAIATGLILWRAAMAVAKLMGGDATAFLAFPLSVMLPALAFGFLVTLRDLASDEGALMQLGAIIHLLLILALPGFALYLALGFPVVFLVVELFEVHMPKRLRDMLKRGVLR
jgi:hypothetical protein